MRRLFEMSFYITLHAKARRGRGGKREEEERDDSLGSYFYNIRAASH